MNFAIILAGGLGERLGGGIPKQFIKVLGKPIIVYTLEIFQEHEEIDEIEVVCVKDYIPILYDYIKEWNLSKVKYIVEGGKDFQHSMINGVRGIEGIAFPDDIVVTSWAASPFITPDIISDGIRVCKEKGNSISAMPAYMLYGKKAIEEDSSIEGIDRDTFVVMNAPQCFRYSYILQLYEEAEQTGIINEVEPHTTTLMYKMGRRLYFSKGNQVNIKITTKEDLDLFFGYVLAKKSKLEG